MDIFLYSSDNCLYLITKYKIRHFHLCLSKGDLPMSTSCLVKDYYYFLKKSIVYLSISAFATLLDVSLLIVGVEILGFYYIISATISYSTSVLLKFSMNKLFVFNKRPGEWKSQMRRFVSVSINGLILTNLFMYIGVELLSFLYLYAKIVTIGLVFIFTAIFHNFFSFSRKTNENPVELVN